MTSLEIDSNDEILRNINVLNLGKLLSLKNVVIVGAGGLQNLEGCENLIDLENLTVKNGNLLNIDSVKNLSKLKNLNFENNSISALKPLENLKSVNSINLTNNSILDDSSYVDIDDQTKSYKNMEIIAKLHTSNGGALKKIYLKGNKISDFKAISSLVWEDWSGFNER